ncbi:MAG: hypothetical protein QOJ08_1085 [Ilumatobacteraceae bacterium]
MKARLAQLNVATLRYPIDDPRTADFVEALPAVNSAGEQSPGYVWRLQSESGDATDIRVFDDPLVIVNLTVWDSIEALKAFAYRGTHRDFFKRRAEWFVEGSTRTALWWIPHGSLPTTDNAKRRLDFIEALGSTPYAFSMGQNHPALVIERVELGDKRRQDLIDKLGEGIDHEATSGFVVAEIEDAPVAGGGYRRLDDDTAEIRRMYVARTARGMRLGVALVAELEAAAKSHGVRRLFLETWPRQVPALEKLGFRHCAPWGEFAPTEESVCMEKTLTA